ncbi:MAG: tRNA (cytidine(34)-2'-O)-methyltransferase [Victivallaceae bacterium]|nr:tRNA (cytidine(34)-2'-O)-methyltransferase [Victivallaceae bacterium]
MASFHLVLVAPEIPQNTGTIGRMAVSVGCTLHLIEPLGFSLEDKYVRRAGMDYWRHLDLRVYPDWETFLEKNSPERLFFFSTHGEKELWDAEYRIGDYLVFGRESSGLPEAFYRKYRDRLVRIPMPGTFSRSLNLANAASIALYEAMRQTRGNW